MIIQVLKCKTCGKIFSADLKREMVQRYCTICKSKDIEIFSFDVKNLED